jgi:hypothetical protein
MLMGGGGDMEIFRPGLCIIETRLIFEAGIKFAESVVSTVAPAYYVLTACKDSK